MTTTRLCFHQYYLFFYYQQVIPHTYYKAVFPSTLPIYLLPIGHPPYLLPGCLSIHITYLSTANRPSSIPTTRLSFHPHYPIFTANRSSSIPTARLSFHPHYPFLYCQQVILHTYYQTVFPSTLPISVLPTGHPPYLLSGCLSIHITISVLPTGHPPYLLPGCFSIHITYFCTANRSSSIPTACLSFHPHYL